MSEVLARFEEQAGIGRLTLNRPGAANAITPDLIGDLSRAIDQVEQSGCRVLLLSGEGANFCVGADLKYFAERLDEFVPQLEQMANDFHSALARLCALPIPLVAAVQGNAVGAGLGLALSSDIIIMADDARLSTGYTRLGLSADAGVSFFLTQAVGPRLARSLLISARFIDSAEAVAIGLVDQSVPAKALLETAKDLARKLADGPTEAYAAIKRLTAEATNSANLAAHLDRERDEILALAGSERVAIAIRAVLKI